MWAKALTSLKRNVASQQEKNDCLWEVRKTVLEVWDLFLGLPPRLHQSNFETPRSYERANPLDEVRDEPQQRLELWEGVRRTYAAKILFR